MALDPAYFFYSDGTITLTNGSDLATGDLVAWDPAVLPFDFVYPNDGTAGITVIKEVLAVDQIRLAKPWAGPTLTDVPYFMVRWANHIDPRFYAVRVSEYLTRLKGIPVEIEDALESALAQIAAAGGKTSAFWDSRAQAMAANIPASVQYVRTAGYATVGDGGAALYKKLGAAPSPSKAWHFQSTDGAWWQLAETTVTPFMFGAKGDYAADETTHLQAFLDYLQLPAPASEGPAATGYCPAGKTFKTSAALSISTPIILDFGSFIYYTGTTGSAFIVGATMPQNGRNTGYKIRLAGLRAMNGNAADPTGVNASGSVGVEVRSMQFSELEVGKIIAFTKYGFYGNCSNNAFGLQHIQDNTIKLGEIAYNGIGVDLHSVDAALGAFQVNRVVVQNSFANYSNFRIGHAGDNNTNNNLFDILATDAPKGGPGVELHGWYNDFRFGYQDGQFLMAADSGYNRGYVANHFGTGPVFTYGGINNWIVTGSPSSAQLPASVGITSGAVVQNTFGVPVVMYFTGNMPNGASVTLAVGPTNTPPDVAKGTNATGAGTFEMPFSVVIPPGYYYKVTLSGGAVASTARFYQAG